MDKIDDWYREYDKMQRIHRTRKWYCCKECDDTGPCVINMSPRWKDLCGGRHEAPDNCLDNADGDYCGLAKWEEISEETALESVKNANKKCESIRRLTERTADNDAGRT